MENDLKEKLNEYYGKMKVNYYENELLLAEHYSNLTYDIATKIYKAESCEIAGLLHNSAIFLGLRKTFESSIEYYRKSINIKSNIAECYIGSANSLAISINGLGHIYRNIGDHQKALNLFIRAVEICLKNDDPNLTPFYYDLARTQKITNNIEEAYQTYQKSIATAKEMIAQKELESHKFYEQIIYNCYNDLAEIELNKADIQQSKKQHQIALQVLENSKSSINTFFEGYKRFEIPAKIYIKEEKFDEAIKQLYKAKDAIVEEYKGFEVGKDLANIIHQIGDCHIHLKQYDKALSTYQKALIEVCNTFNIKDVNNQPAIEDVYNKRSAIASLSYKAATFLLIFEEQNKIEALELAYKTYRLITELIPVTRRDYVEENSKFQLADETRNIYEKAIKTCLKLFYNKNDETFLHQAFAFAESSKAIVLQENLQANYALEGVDEPVQQQDIDYRSKIAFYANSINTNKTIEGNEAKIKNWQKELFNCKEEYEDFLKQIEKNYPNYYAIKYADSITNIKSVQKVLTIETALIEYFVGKNNIYVFVITRDQFYVQSIKIDQAMLEKDIQQFKQLIEQPDRTGSIEVYNTFKKLSNQLYKDLLHNSLSQLNASIKNLIIIPDGLLYNIAFDALIIDDEELEPAAFYSPENLTYLFKQFAISFNYSTSLLLKTFSFPNQSYQNKFAGFAPTFENLFNNEEEVKQIKACIGGSTQLGKSATFDAFKLKSKGSKILHLSTHAKQSIENHKLNEIQFADTTITNYHIENMQIEAKLIVLSACETAAGLLQDGEGAMSLSRSFFLAGCPSLLSNLWLADDESTVDIMLYFYEYLNVGKAKDVALQLAKLKYTKEAGIRGSHPFYWAGFMQSGNRKALF